MVTEGELVLMQDEGEYLMRPGDCAAWPAGDSNGHCFLNRSDREARFLVVGSKAPHEVATYSDIDFMLEVKDGASQLPLAPATAPTLDAVHRDWPLSGLQPSTKESLTMPIFTTDIDADGVATIAWDLPGKSMNVLTDEGIAELDAADGRRSSPTPP